MRMCFCVFMIALILNRIAVLEPCCSLVIRWCLCALYVTVQVCPSCNLYSPQTTGSGLPCMLCAVVHHCCLGLGGSGMRTSEAEKCSEYHWTWVLKISGTRAGSHESCTKNYQQGKGFYCWFKLWITKESIHQMVVNERSFKGEEKSFAVFHGWGFTK